MPRDVLPITAGQLQEDKTFIILARMDFPDQPLYVHSRIGEFDYDGNTYLGMGEFGSISVTDEDTEQNPQRIRLGLSNIGGYWNSKVITDSMQYQNRDAYIYLGLLDESRAIIGDAITIFRGKTGNISFTEGAESSVSLELTNQFVVWNRASNLRYTDTQQQELFTGDTGLRFVQDTLSNTIWRQAST